MAVTVTNKIIERTIYVDMANGNAGVALKVLSYRDNARLKTAWATHLDAKDETSLAACIDLVIDGYTSDEILESFTQTEIYELIGRAFTEAALTGLERKKLPSSPTECAENSAPTAGEENADSDSAPTT